MSLSFVIPPNLVPTENPTVPIDPTLPIETTTLDIDNSIPIETTTLHPEIEAIYDGCGDTKVCFGIPPNCYSDKSCQILGAVTFDNHNFTFELLAQGKEKIFKICLKTTLVLCMTIFA